MSLDEFLRQNLLGIILSLIGFILAYIFYRRSLNRPRLAYAYDSIQVIGRNSSFASELKIIYCDKEVERVTKSVVIIWNYGDATIEGDKVVSSDPLRIRTLEGSEILNVSVDKATRDVNRFSVSVEVEKQNEVKCSFDYLDPSDGVVIDILHTGERTIDIVGSIRGIPKGVSQLPFIPAIPINFLLFQFITSIVFGVLVTVGAFYMFTGWNVIFAWLVAVGSVVLILIGMFRIVINLMVQKRRPPLSLLANHLLLKD